jgi:hypothetical protein
MPAPQNDAQKQAEALGDQVKAAAEGVTKAVGQDGAKQGDFLRDYLKVDSLQGNLDSLVEESSPSKSFLGARMLEQFQPLRLNRTLWLK